ncbi:MAG: hypothetical protein RSA49_03695 [Anaerovoracaceae bacterium]
MKKKTLKLLIYLILITSLLPANAFAYISGSTDVISNINTGSSFVG